MRSCNVINKLFPPVAMCTAALAASLVRFSYFVEGPWCAEVNCWVVRVDAEIKRSRSVA